MKRRIFEPERKEEILKVIEENNYPLVWLIGPESTWGEVVHKDYRPGDPFQKLEPYDFSDFDEKVLALDEVFEPPQLILIPVHTANHDISQIVDPEA